MHLDALPRMASSGKLLLRMKESEATRKERNGRKYFEFIDIVSGIDNISLQTAITSEAENLHHKILEINTG